MMRAGKSQGGLTRGRGMEETVRSTWLSTLTACASVHSALSRVTKTEREQAEHAEVGTSRIRRDMQDLTQIRSYFETYSPFRFGDSSKLINICNGVCSGVNDVLNCDKADEVGYSILQQ
jgi:hypothetical protein